jgi:hypothetical protein
LVAVDRARVTAGVNERGDNAKPKILVNSGGHILQPRYWVIRVFGWVIYAIGNHQRLRLGHYDGFGN